MRNGIETKVAASTGASLAVTLAFAVVHWLAPTVATPPAYIVGGLATLVTLGAGYLAPHTHLRPAPPEGLAETVEAWKALGKLKAPEPSVQPSATGTGTVAMTGTGTTPMTGGTP